MREFGSIVGLGMVCLIVSCGQGEQTLNDRGRVAETYDAIANPEKQIQVTSASASGPNKHQIRLDIPLTLENGSALTRASTLSTRIVAEILDYEADTSISATNISDMELTMSLKGPSGGTQTLKQAGPIAYFDLQFTDEDGEYQISAESVNEFESPESITVVVDRQGPDIQGSGEFKTLIGDGDDVSHFLSVDLKVRDLTGAKCVLRDPNKNELPANYIDGEQGSKSYTVQVDSLPIDILPEYVSLDCVDPAGNLNAFNLVSESL